jgi:hypothetical protein
MAKKSTARVAEDPLDIPAFLKVSAEDRKAAWDRNTQARVAQDLPAYTTTESSKSAFRSSAPVKPKKELSKQDEDVLTEARALHRYWVPDPNAKLGGKTVRPPLASFVKQVRDRRIAAGTYIKPKRTTKKRARKLSLEPSKTQLKLLRALHGQENLKRINWDKAKEAAGLGGAVFKMLRSSCERREWLTPEGRLTAAGREVLT